jgi:hypothetical protein
MPSIVSVRLRPRSSASFPASNDPRMVPTSARRR